VNGQLVLIDDDGKTIQPSKPVQVYPQAVGDVDDRSYIQLAFYVLNLLYPRPRSFKLLEDRVQVKVGQPLSQFLSLIEQKSGSRPAQVSCDHDDVALRHPAPFQSRILLDLPYHCCHQRDAVSSHNVPARRRYTVSIVQSLVSPIDLLHFLDVQIRGEFQIDEIGERHGAGGGKI